LDATERRGDFLHRHPPLEHGPRLPDSLLMYRDGDRWIVRQDEMGRYSSRSFWLKHLGVLMKGGEPLDVEDGEWATANRLGISLAEQEALIGRLSGKIDTGTVSPICSY